MQKVFQESCFSRLFNHLFYLSKVFTHIFRQLILSHLRFFQKSEQIIVKKEVLHKIKIAKIVVQSLAKLSDQQWNRPLFLHNLRYNLLGKTLLCLRVTRNLRRSWEFLFSFYFKLIVYKCLRLGSQFLMRWDFIVLFDNSEILLKGRRIHI